MPPQRRIPRWIAPSIVKAAGAARKQFRLSWDSLAIVAVYGATLWLLALGG